MNIVTMLAIIAGAFGVFMGASPLLQALRSHKRKSSSDVSISFIFILLAGGVAWLSYGISIKNPALIISNSIGVISSLITLIVSFKWKTKD